MSRKNLTYIYVLMDRSGSMISIRDDVIGGFNTLLQDQQKENGKCLMTYAQFDNEYEEVFIDQNILNIKPLNRDSFVPRGCTALLDAWGKSLINLKERIDKISKKDKPNNIIFVVITDGEENSSIEFKREDIFKMVNQSKRNGWKFTFLAANQDAIKEGCSYGIDTESSLDFSCSERGLTSTYKTLSRNISGIRTKKIRGFNYSDKDRTEAIK